MLERGEVANRTVEGMVMASREEEGLVTNRDGEGRKVTNLSM